jgi:glycosidase
VSFPYTPIFNSKADGKVKSPQWLNDRTLYHNRGNTTFSGENSVYGDFFGLDDLFTEHPRVVEGMTTCSAVGGLWTASGRHHKHVNMEFWQRFGPALQGYAASLGNEDFFMFGEVFDANPEFMSRYTTEGKLQATVDFGFQSGAGLRAVRPHRLRDLFASDDWYTDADSNAYSLPTFLGNHDMGRIGRFVATANPGASDDELLARDRLAHTLMYLVRGMPVVYYGDEQGFSGPTSDIGDKRARQDMFATQTPIYQDDVIVDGGDDAAGTGEHYGTDTPLYRHISELASLRDEHPALADGAQIHRYASDSAGVYGPASTRISGSTPRRRNNATSA